MAFPGRLEISPNLNHPNRKSSFKEWWESVFIKLNENCITREYVIRSMMNKDGGAHIDQKLDKKYHDLCNNNDMLFNFTETMEIFSNQAFAIVRQSAYELELSIIEGLKDLVDLGPVPDYIQISRNEKDKRLKLATDLAECGHKQSMDGNFNRARDLYDLSLKEMECQLETNEQFLEKAMDIYFANGRTFTYTEKNEQISLADEIDLLFKGKRIRNPRLICKYANSIFLKGLNLGLLGKTTEALATYENAIGKLKHVRGVEAYKLKLAIYDNILSEHFRGRNYNEVISKSDELICSLNELEGESKLESNKHYLDKYGKANGNFLSMILVRSICMKAISFLRISSIDYALIAYEDLTIRFGDSTDIQIQYEINDLKLEIDSIIKAQESN